MISNQAKKEKKTFISQYSCTGQCPMNLLPLVSFPPSGHLEDCISHFHIPNFLRGASCRGWEHSLPAPSCHQELAGRRKQHSEVSWGKEAFCAPTGGEHSELTKNIFFVCTEKHKN